MNKYDKAKRIMDDYRTGLIFPFHINHKLRQSEHFYNKDYAEKSKMLKYAFLAT